MSSPTVVAAFTAKLAAEWLECPVIDENTDAETPSDGSPFVFLEFPFSTREQITFGVPGENTFREEGAARLVLNIGRSVGLLTGREWAEQLVDLFIGKDLGGVIIREIDGPVTDGRNEDGMYFMLSIGVGYEHDSMH